MYFATILVCVVWLGFYLWYWTTYNHFIAIRNAVEQSWSHVEVELQRRYDLIQNLVNVVKAYAHHEHETLLDTVKERSANSKNMNVREANSNIANDARLLMDIMVLVEKYPDLKADKQFLTLQKSLIETENRIADRRSAYNACVNRYETYRESFPSMLIAWSGLFIAEEFFDAENECAKAVEVILT